MPKKVPRRPSVLGRDEVIELGLPPEEWRPVQLSKGLPNIDVGGDDADWYKRDIELARKLGGVNHPEFVLLCNFRDVTDADRQWLFDAAQRAVHIRRRDAERKRSRAMILKALDTLKPRLRASPNDKQLLNEYRIWKEALAQDSPRPETGPQKSARLRRTGRVLDDVALAVRFAAQVSEGRTTAQVREHLGIGAVRAQRIRRLAVQLGLLKPRQRAR